MYNRVENVLYDKRLNNQPWRQYSPGGKRRKVTNIPFGGQLSKLKAQGTKVIGVTPAAFSNPQHSHMAMYNFQAPPYPSPSPRIPPYPYPYPPSGNEENRRMPRPMPGNGYAYSAMPPKGMLPPPPPQYKYRPISQYTREELMSMTPEQRKVAARLESIQEFDTRYRKDSARRGARRLILDTIGEGRGLSRELRGWSDLALGRKRINLQQNKEKRIQDMLEGKFEGDRL